jgi:hypothetical protein
VKASIKDFDKLTSMKVPLAKHPFENNTVLFLFGLITNQLGCMDGLSKDGCKFGPSEMSEKLSSAVGSLQGIADIVNASEFILEQIELTEYLMMGHNIYIDRIMKKNVCSSGTATMHTNQANSNV